MRAPIPSLAWARGTELKKNMRSFRCVFECATAQPVPVKASATMLARPVAPGDQARQRQASYKPGLCQSHRLLDQTQAHTPSTSWSRDEHIPPTPSMHLQPPPPSKPSMHLPPPSAFNLRHTPGPSFNPQCLQEGVQRGKLCMKSSPTTLCPLQWTAITQRHRYTETPCPAPSTPRVPFAASDRSHLDIQQLGVPPPACSEG